MKIYDALSIAFYPTLLSIIFTIIFSLYSPAGSLTAMQSILVGVAFLAILPTTPLLYYMKKGSIDINVSIREKRTKFYAFAIISQSIAAVIFFLSGNTTMLSYSAAVVFVTITVLLINLRWKISAHSSAIATDVAAVFYVFSALWPLLFIPLVSFIRYKARAHSLMQLLAGAVIGFMVTLITFLAIYP
ncbi:MAG: hypothetical protein HZB67_00990 [Candidatus Aenigmarchaeota archaeon]|nr:hypothetical protein [Candidatus Aenigmarchaeota archaeon]